MSGRTSTAPPCPRPLRNAKLRAKNHAWKRTTCTTGGGRQRREWTRDEWARPGAVHVMDRNVLSMVLEPIRREFALSDGQLGLLSGLAFAIFYAIAGLPLGAAADRVNRRNMIFVCLTLWSAMTALSGMAGNFLQLLAARIGVGIGEAGGGPPCSLTSIPHGGARPRSPPSISPHPSGR
jgi:Major Facilitator Superfamily